MSTKLVIVQPYIPAYRVSFFEGLRHRLLDIEVECVVAAGRSRGSQAARGDSAHPDWLVPLEHKTVSIRGRSIDVDIKTSPWKHAGAVILGLEGSSLPVYRALLSGRTTGIRVGLWGHIRPYVAQGNRIDLELEKIQMHLADHVFAYTPGGQNYAINAGIEKNKVTTVMNSLDTGALEAAKKSLTMHRVQMFAEKWGINSYKTFCFVGGLDKSKRISFLADVLERIWKQDRQVQLLVGGNGPQKGLLQPAFNRGQAIDMGYLDTADKALVMAASQGIIMPGRVGLVAVDALVMGRPILTTNWPYHAPEVEYLVEGLSRRTSEDDPAAYAKLILQHVDSHSKKLATGSTWKYPSIDEMIENFAVGVEAMLGAKRLLY